MGVRSAPLLDAIEDYTDYSNLKVEDLFISCGDTLSDFTA
jgi:hypothetical protein